MIKGLVLHHIVPLCEQQIGQAESQAGLGRPPGADLGRISAVLVLQVLSKNAVIRHHLRAQLTSQLPCSSTVTRLSITTICSSPWHNQMEPIVRYRSQHTLSSEMQLGASCNNR